MPRTILLDANVIDQLNRGNLQVARTLKALLASNAKVYMSMQGYRELTSQPGKSIAGIGPDLPRTAVANGKLLKDLGIPVARTGSFGSRVSVYGRNATATAFSAADQMVLAQARAMNAEVWSFDKAFRTDPNNSASFGVTVAPESQLPFSAQTSSDYRVARRTMGLPPTPITVGGEIKPRGKPGTGLKGTSSATPAAVTQSGVIDTNPPKPPPPSAVVGSRSTDGTTRGVSPKNSSPPARPPTSQPKGGTFTPDVDTPNLKKRIIPKKIGIPKGLIIDIVIEYTIGKTIEALETEMSEVNQDLIQSQWASHIYPKIKNDIDLALYYEKTAPEKLKANQGYIKLDWEVLLREQSNDFSDVVVWSFKLLYGKPGFVNVFEGVKYVNHKIDIYGGDSRPKIKPKIKADKADRKLLHEPHRDNILIWDKEVHKLAHEYRKLAQKSMDQLNRIHAEVITGLKHFSSKKEEKSAIKWITKKESEIEAALQVYNFKEAKKKAKSLVSVVGGQFTNRVRDYVINRTNEKISVLQVLMSTDTGKLYKLSKKHKQNQRKLLSMFLEQEFENLR